jgi:hypothetical protein
VFVLVVLLRPKGKKAFITEVNDEEEGKEIKEIDTSLVLNRRGDKRRKRLFFRVEGGK